MTSSDKVKRKFEEICRYQEILSTLWFAFWLFFIIFTDKKQKNKNIFMKNERKQRNTLFAIGGKMNIIRKSM